MRRQTMQALPRLLALARWYCLIACWRLRVGSGADVSGVFLSATPRLCVRSSSGTTQRQALPLAGATRWYCALALSDRLLALRVVCETSVQYSRRVT